MSHAVVIHNGLTVTVQDDGTAKWGSDYKKTRERVLLEVESAISDEIARSNRRVSDLREAMRAVGATVSESTDQEKK